jgi:hypothetical protein
MMPYQSYQLYQAERVKTAAEIRHADEQLGELAQSLSSLWSGVTRRVARRQRPVQTGGRLSRNAAGPSCASELW